MRFLAPLATTLVLAACGGAGDADAPRTPYEALLREYATEVVPAWYRWKEAEWRAHTEVVPGDTQRAQQAVAGYEQWRAKASDPKWVRQARELGREAKNGTPTPMEKAALDALSRTARHYPVAEAELVARIDQKAGLQARFRKKATPKLDGEEIPAEDLARRFAMATDTAERKALWRAMLSPYGDLKPTYAELRDLRNELARKGGWQNHMDAVFDRYGVTASEMLDLMSGFELALRPVYQELHTWARSDLGNRYLVAPPELIPAHWLPSPLGEDWRALAVVENGDVEPALQAMGAKKMVQGVEDWFVGTGLAPLPTAFWERSNLFPVPPGARIGKTQGSSTWDLNLSGDVRVLMSAKPTAAWMSAATRELAFAHAYHLRAEGRLYSPIRQQGPDAVVAALGVWSDLATTRPAHLVQAGLLDAPSAEMPTLLGEALTYVTFVQFGSGAVVPFEYDVYAEALAPGQMNSRWWGLVARHQGVFPPETRTERWADFLAVDALQDAPGHYAEHVLAVVIAFQIHEAVCQQLGIDPRSGDLTSQKKVAEVFQQIATNADVTDWRALVQQVTGAGPSADAMVRYFQPLQSWLATQNAARTPTLPPLR